MAGSVSGKVEFFCTIKRDVGGGVMHTIFYAKFYGTVSGTQPDGCTPGLFGVDLADPNSRGHYDTIRGAAFAKLPCIVTGDGVLTLGHPSEAINNAQVNFPA